MFRSARDVCSLGPTKSKTKRIQSVFESYGCDLCEAGGWTSETEVELHKTKMHFKRSFISALRKRDDYCCICIKQFPSKASVIKHIKTEHLLSTETCTRVEREIFVCDMCTAIFFNKENLFIHIKYAHLDKTNSKLVKCELCLRKIQTRNIPAHFYMHNIQSVSTCRICLNKYMNTKALKKHLKTHPYYLKCDMCLFETNRLEAFQNHVLLSHKKAVKANTMGTDTDKALTADKDLTRVDKNLTTVDKNLTTVDKNLMTVDKNLTKVDKNLTTVDKNLTTVDKNLMTVDKNLKTVDEKLTAASDLMYIDVAANENDILNNDMDLITVIEISDNDPLTDTIMTDCEIKNADKEMKTELLIDTDLISGIGEQPIANTVIVEEVLTDTDSLTEEIAKADKSVNNSVDDFKKYFIPKTPAYLRLQRVAGVRGVRLSNDVHVCILCREICVDAEEMVLHVEEHKMSRLKKISTYQCSCGEGFTNKVLLKHHAFKNKHVIDAK